MTCQHTDADPVASGGSEVGEYRALRLICAGSISNGRDGYLSYRRSVPGKLADALDTLHHAGCLTFGARGLGRQRRVHPTAGGQTRYAELRQKGLPGG